MKNNKNITEKAAFNSAAGGGMFDGNLTLN